MTALKNKQKDISRANKASQDNCKSRLPGLLFSILFFVCCLVPSVVSFAGFETPNLEKRTLAPKPSFTINDKINIDYTEDFDAWFGDNFPLRSYLISGWHSINRLVPGNAFSDRVISGSDGWLFFADTLNDHLGFGQLNELEIARLKAVIELQNKWLLDQDIAFIFTIAPNKNSIYPQYMPANYLANKSADNAALFADMEIDAYVDLFNLLRANAADTKNPNELIYHQEDSHWNNSGAKLVTEFLIEQAEERMRVELAEELMPGQPVDYRRDWQGDLAVMLYPSGPIPDWQHYYTETGKYRYTRPIRSLEDMKIMTDSGSGQHNLLMFRDSFANALIPMLSPVFAEAFYSRAMPVDYRLIEETDANLVILEIVERNIRNLIDYAPIMPARELNKLPDSLDLNEQKSAIATNTDISLYKSEEGDLIRFGAVFHQEKFQNGVRVIIEADKKYYESYPIIDRKLIDSANLQNAAAEQPMDPESADSKSEDNANIDSGFTITLDQETYLIIQEAQQLNLYVSDDNVWTVVTLPR